MVGLTYTPPLVPALQSARALGLPDLSTALVLSILAGAAAGAVGDSLSDTLAVATGPGNILTGTVTSALPGNSFTLTTAANAELTLRYPPELIIDIGSVVTLRVAGGGPTPQATILSIDGRPVSVTAPLGGPAAPVAPMTTASSGPPPPASGANLPGSGNASAYAASIAALLTLESEPAPPPDPANLSKAPAAQTDAETLATQILAAEIPNPSVSMIVASLVRPAAVAYGQQPLALGTRYLLSLTQDTDEPAAPVDVETPPEFVPQTATVPGRVLPPLKFGELIVETPLGTLSLATDESVAVGTSLRLSIAAVAAPLPGGISGASAQPKASLIGEALAVLATAAPSIAKQATDTLLLPTGGALLAAAWKYLADSGTRIGAKDTATQLRKALIEAGRSDLADRLEASSGAIGEIRPQRTADGWVVTTLPFLGLASQEPVRLYVRDDDGNPDAHAHDRGARLIIEVKLRRLGPMQFEGLSRERRLDLVVRTAEPLESGLNASIEEAFKGAVESCGCAGEISFGRLTRFPFAAPDHTADAIKFEA